MREMVTDRRNSKHKHNMERREHKQEGEKRWRGRTETIKNKDEEGKQEGRKKIKRRGDS